MYGRQHGKTQGSKEKPGGRNWGVGISARDKDLHTTTNKCSQRLIKIMYAVF